MRFPEMIYERCSSPLGEWGKTSGLGLFLKEVLAHRWLAWRGLLSEAKMEEITNLRHLALLDGFQRLDQRKRSIYA